MSIIVIDTDGKEKAALSVEEAAEKLGITISGIPQFLKAHPGTQLLKDQEHTGERYLLEEEIKPYFIH